MAFENKMKEEYFDLTKREKINRMMEKMAQ
jgi:hypothetical protein